MNDALPPGEESPPTSVTNYTTAADATNAAQEETAADVSAIDQDDIEVNSCFVPTIIICKNIISFSKTIRIL